MPKVIHFEIESKHPEQTIAFYEKAFGWQFTKFEGDFDYWLITAGTQEEQGINGALMRGSEETLRTINTIEVPSITEYLTRVEEAGGKIESPAMEIPGVGVFAYCSNPEGLKFGIIQMK
jgi:predicted enzyme related to lactoylglutathione lyase